MANKNKLNSSEKKKLIYFIFKLNVSSFLFYFIWELGNMNLPNRESYFFIQFYYNVLL